MHVERARQRVELALLGWRQRQPVARRPTKRRRGFTRPQSRAAAPPDARRSARASTARPTAAAAAREPRARARRRRRSAGSRRRARRGRRAATSSPFSPSRTTSATPPAASRSPASRPRAPRRRVCGKFSHVDGSSDASPARKSSSTPLARQRAEEARVPSSPSSPASAEPARRARRPRSRARRPRGARRLDADVERLLRRQPAREDERRPVEAEPARSSSRGGSSRQRRRRVRQHASTRSGGTPHADREARARYADGSDDVRRAPQRRGRAPRRSGARRAHPPDALELLERRRRTSPPAARALVRRVGGQLHRRSASRASASRATTGRACPSCRRRRRAARGARRAARAARVAHAAAAASATTQRTGYASSAGARVGGDHDLDLVPAAEQERRHLGRVARGPADVGRPDPRDDEDLHAADTGAAGSRVHAARAAPIQSTQKTAVEASTAPRRAGRAPLARRSTSSSGTKHGHLDPVRDDAQAGPADRDRERLRPARRRTGAPPASSTSRAASVACPRSRRRRASPISQGISNQSDRHGDDHQRRRADDVAAEPREHRRRPPASKSRVCSVSSTSRAGALSAREALSAAPARCGSSPACVDRRDRRRAAPCRARARPRRARGERRRGTRSCERRGPRASGTRARRREAPEGGEPAGADRRRRDDLRERPARSTAAVTPYSAADRDRRRAAAPIETARKRAADVVAAAQDERAGRDVPRAPERAASGDGDEQRHESRRSTPQTSSRTARARRSRARASSRRRA